jgi:hypothetical protein
MAHADVVAGLLAAARVGASNADVVAVEARKATENTTNQASASSMPAAPSMSRSVVSLTGRRPPDPTAVLASLPADRRAAPTVAAYDELLPHRNSTTPPASTKANHHKGNAS